MSELIDGIFMKFGTGILQKKGYNRREERKTRLSFSRKFLLGLNEFPSGVSKLYIGSGRIL
jgi:hypothetical protein